MFAYMVRATEPKFKKWVVNHRPDQDFVLFDICVGDWWLQRADVEDVAMRLGLDIVPVIGKAHLRCY